MKLTARQIQTTKPKDKDFKLTDGGGLFLLVKPNGAKYWRMKYRIAGKEKLLALGVYPDVSLSFARQKRDEARKLIVEGGDPSADKKEKKMAQRFSAENTFESLAREWHKTKSDRWSVRYRDEIIDTFEKDIFPSLGRLQISEIKPMELLESLKRIEKRGALEKTRKVRQRCGEVFRYAIATGRATYNPAQDLTSTLTPPSKTHFPFLRASTVGPFLRDLSGYTGSTITKTATRILMLTGVRTQELRFAKWHDLDLDEGIWQVPPELMKMKRPHIVPLSSQAIALFEQMRPISGKYSLVFIGRSDHTKPISKESVNQVIEMLGYKGQMTGHGFRHQMSTILHEQGFNSAWIESQLAHVDKNSIRGTYNHAQYLDGRREMLQWYADYLDSLESAITG